MNPNTQSKNHLAKSCIFFSVFTSAIHAVTNILASAKVNAGLKKSNLSLHFLS